MAMVMSMLITVNVDDDVVCGDDVDVRDDDDDDGGDDDDDGGGGGDVHDDGEDSDADDVDINARGDGIGDDMPTMMVIVMIRLCQRR